MPYCIGKHAVECRENPGLGALALTDGLDD